MAQETVDFSVIKQKIIKTDKILRMYQETSHKLKKVAQAYKEIKSKYDQTVLNFNRLELENERCTFNLENVKLSQDKLEKENTELREQKTLLEDKYNLQSVQCQLEIKKLGDELKNVQEVKITGNTIPKRKRSSGTSDDGDKKCKTLTEEIKRLNDKEIMYKRDIKELILKNEKLVKELEFFTSNKVCAEKVVKDNQDKDKEVNDLKRKIACLALDRSRLITMEEENENLKHQLMSQELILFDTNKKISTSEFSTQTDIFLSYTKVTDMNESTPQQISKKEAENEGIIESKNISCCISNENKLKGTEYKTNKNKKELMKQEITLFDVEGTNSTSNFGTDILPINQKRSCYVQTVENTYDLQETLQTENMKLKQSIVDYETQIIDLKAKLEIYLKQSFPKSTQTDEIDLDTDCFEEILKEMCVPIPMILSPMSPAYQENNGIDAPTQLSHTALLTDIKDVLESSAPVIPQVIITPPTPTLESVVNFESEILPKHEDNIDIKEKGSTKSNNKLPSFKRVNRMKYRSPFISNEFIKFRNSYCKRPMILNKEVLRREIRKARKIKYQDCVLKALQTLKRSKINFTISNESILSKCCLNNSCSNDCSQIYSTINRHQVNTVKSKVLISPSKYKNAKYLTEKLVCNFPSCNKGNSYMLLSKLNEIPELLGFFDIKDETTTPSSSRIGNILESKPSSFITTINSTLSNSEEFLETLANMVSEKLREKEDLSRRRLSISNSELFNSETEAELEQLSEKSTKDELKMNRLLLKQAWGNKTRYSTSSLEEKEIDSGRIKYPCNQSIETAQFDSNYNNEENVNKESQIITKILVESIGDDTNASISNTTEIGVMDEATQDSYDSMKFPTCPELISPLSSTSKGSNTNKSSICFNSSEKPDSYFQPNSGNADTYVTEEDTSNFSPVEENGKEGISHLHTSCKNIGNETPINFNNVNQYFEDSELNRLEECNEENENSNILHLRSLMNISTWSPRLDRLLHKSDHKSGLECVAIDFPQTNRLELGRSEAVNNDNPLRGSLEKQNLKQFINTTNEFDGSSLKNKDSRVSIGESAETLGNLSSKQLSQVKREILFDTEKVNETTSIERQPTNNNNKLGREDYALDAPQSPLQEQVELCNPVIIPLEKNIDKDTESKNIFPFPCNLNDHTLGEKILTANKKDQENKLNNLYNGKSQPLEESNRVNCTLSGDDLFDLKSCCEEIFSVNTDLNIANNKTSDENNGDKDTKTANINCSNMYENKNKITTENIEECITNDIIKEFDTNGTTKNSLESTNLNDKELFSPRKDDDCKGHHQIFSLTKSIEHLNKRQSTYSNKCVKYSSVNESADFMNKISFNDGEKKDYKFIQDVPRKEIRHTYIPTYLQYPLCNYGQVNPLEKLECENMSNSSSCPKSPKPLEEQHVLNKKQSPYRSENNTEHSAFKKKDIKPLTSVILGQIEIENPEDMEASKTITDFIDALESEENESIPSCPQSPLNDTFANETSFTPPKIIPLNNLRSANISNLNFYGSSLSTQSGFSTKHEDKKSNSVTEFGFSNVNDNDHHSIQEKLECENVSNLSPSSKLPKPLEKQHDVNKKPYRSKNNTEYSAVKEKCIKLTSVNEASENIKDILDGVKSEEKESSSIPSCPQSPLNDPFINETNFTPLKIIPLNNLRSEDMSNILNPEENSNSGTNFFSVNDNNCHAIQEKLECENVSDLLSCPKLLKRLKEQHDLDRKPSYSSENNDEHSAINESSVKLTSVILRQAKIHMDNEESENITTDILDGFISQEREGSSIPSCPQSPLNDSFINETSFTPPKIIPLNNLRSEDISNLDLNGSSLSNQSGFSTQHEKNSNCGSDFFKEVKTLSPKHADSKVPQGVRRSQRNLKRNKDILENKSTPKENDAEECACITNTKGLKGSTPEIKYKRQKISVEKIQPLQSLKNVSPEMVIQVKRKRGRPRKYLAVKTDTYIKGDTTLESEDSNEKSPQKRKNKNVHCLEDSIMLTTELDDPTNEIAPINSDLTGEEESNCQSNLIPICVPNNTNKKEPCNNKTNKRKGMTKLKSAILKQFKEKRKMFQTNVKTTNFVDNVGTCDLKRSNLSESNIEIRESSVNVCTESGKKLGEECTTKECDIKRNSNVKKIHIVQNILIPPNSNYAVDLLNREENTNYEVVPKCDIRLDGLNNPSQRSSKTVENSPQMNEMSISTIKKIPLKKKVIRIKRIKKLNQDKDILSMIMDEMTKGKPTVSPKRLNKIKEDIPASIVEREWRKNILDIAEITHNFPTDVTNILYSTRTFMVNPKQTLSGKDKILLSRLVKLSSDEKIAAEVILEFKRHDVDSIAHIILHKVSQDIFDKVDNKYYPAPLMTKTQRILLNLMVHLEHENVENLMDTFLTKTELFLFKIQCGIKAMVPVTRLYVAVCRLRGNVNRLRTFCCNAFWCIGDLAIPLLFTVLTSWSEILPMEPELRYYPITKVFIQIVHLKACNLPGYNLLPLRLLLNQFYGYPNERWNCDELFEELFQQYLRNPGPYTDLAIRLLCKNKDTKWVFKKINEYLKPLIYKIPEHNVNFKATVIILIGHICKQFKPNKALVDEKCLIDLHRWLTGLTEGDNVSDIVERSVDVSLSMLPRKKQKRKHKNVEVNMVTKAVVENKNQE